LCRSAFELARDLGLCDRPPCEATIDSFGVVVCLAVHDWRTCRRLRGDHGL